MDQVKVGKFISEQRKLHGLTQEQLGEKLGIGGRSVSKWERGVNMPDIEKLEQLCDILDVSVISMLNGGKSISINNKSENMSLFTTIKYYIKNTKKLYLLIFIILTVFILFGFSLLFLFNNYNKNKIYSINSLNNNYEIQGYLIFNQDQNIFVINEIDFQGDIVGTIDEPLIKSININVLYENKEIMSYSENITDDMNNRLSSVMNTLSFSIEENKENNSNIINYNTDLSKIKINIEYITIDDINEQLEVDINFKETFANDKIVY